MKLLVVLMLVIGLQFAAQGEIGWVTPNILVPNLSQQTFFSGTVQSMVSYFIYLPTGMEGQRLPVLYWLHGGGGGLTGLRFLVAHFHVAMAVGKIPPMILVFPNGLELSLWVDSKDMKMPLETILVSELIPHIDADYLTIASAQGRIIEGFSMGGYGAARLGFLYPDFFGAVSILAGGPLQPVFDESPRVGPHGRETVLQTVFGGEQEYFQALSPWVLAQQNADSLRSHEHIRLVIGEQDEMLRINREFSVHLVELGIPHVFTLLPGIRHDAIGVLTSMGEANWEFYRSFLQTDSIE